HSAWWSSFRSRRVGSRSPAFALVTPGCSQAEALPDRRRQRGLIERVEVQSRGAAREEALAELGDDLESERADRRDVVAVAFEAPPNPARDFRAARVGEARELHE